MVTSLKGGVGKSTVSANLGCALADRGHQVLAVDCDFNMRSLDLLLGVEDAVIYDLNDAILGTVSPEKTFIRCPACENLFLCAAPYAASAYPETHDFARIIRTFRQMEKFSYIIIDTPGDTQIMQQRAAAAADIALVLTTHQPAAVRAAERTAALLSAQNVPRCYMVLNSFRQKDVKEGLHPGIISMIDRIGVPLIGVVPDEPQISALQETGTLAVHSKECPNTATAFRNIAARLDGDSVPIFRGFRNVIRNISTM